MMRPPAVIVTENEFNMLYGASRAKMKQAELTIRFFRRIVAIQVSISAGTEIIIAAAEFASASPGFVIFPGFFDAAAIRYREIHPEIPVFIAAGRNSSMLNSPHTGENTPVYIYTDTDSDLFRAGVCAAHLAGENGRVYIIQDETLRSPSREKFEDGLKSRGYSGYPVYVNAGIDISASENISCLVAIGSSAKFFEQNQKIPVILFTWADPDITPSNVKLIFDDSLWTAAAQILQFWDGKPGSLAPESLENFRVSSELTVPWGRNREGVLFYEKLAGKKVNIGKF